MLNAKKHKILFWAGAATATLFIFIFIVGLINYQRFAHGLFLTGQDFSGLSYETGRQKILELTETVKKTPIEIVYQDRQWLAAPSEIGLEFDAEKTAKEMFSIGHNKSFLLNLKQQIELFFHHRYLPLSYAYNQQKMQIFFANNFSALENQAKDATLKYDAALDDFYFISGQNGEIFDQGDFEKQIDEKLVSADEKPIMLQKISQKPKITEDKNNSAKNKAEHILSLAPYALTYASSTWPVEKQILIEWLDFIGSDNPGQSIMQATISESDVKDFLSGLAPAINQEPVNAILTIKDGKPSTFSLSQNGAELKIDDSAKKIGQEISQGVKNIELVVAKTEPQISTKTINALGLTDLIGQGISDFAGSPKNRIHNITVGSAKINGLLVAPGEEFSFVKSIGEIGPDQGYVTGLVIKGNQTIPEYGGGVCQISTTVFRAAVNSGLKITARFPHSYAVQYYNPQGFDATVYPPNPDLKFINDTPNYLLIQARIEGTKLIFDFYGTKDGREVKIIGPTILQSYSSGALKTVLTQEIWRNGTLDHKATFYSNYRAPNAAPVVKNPLE